ncbi:hypothetical protein IAQ61_003999 [Plenodomus lingam]|uniref:Predicted protein n=1 Tax=Leptosphaeria maculans (strain JN3 / isolate v23.1.3 / race Av1-4-5-6-7-8) TaxID=985895 RepID=E4ZQX3_LEPMJ|nr:predicted protein [Plenodomus lingam JN3]KAH9874809.1 hypothetical protein IAQ61_003999 [Plenodomus lingam]CBX94128.1 predicted protein [Plenodomus lingam JN3]
MKNTGDRHHFQFLLSRDSPPPAAHEGEAPTPPSSPVLGTFAPQPAPKASQRARPYARTLSSSARKPILAHESRCAICKRKIPRYSKRGQVNHVNSCWSALREAAETAKTKRLAEMNAMEIAERVLSRAGKNPKGEMGALVEEVDAATADADTEAENEDPLTGVEMNTLPEGCSDSCLPPPPKTAPTTCIVCGVKLPDLALDALLHQRHCLRKAYPPQCPVCHIKFPPSPNTPLSTHTASSPSISVGSAKKWTPDTVLEHLHYCIRRVPPVQSEHHADFTATLAVCDRPWALATRILVRSFGPKKNWTLRDHRRSNKDKLFGKGLEVGKAYTIAATPLRTSTSFIGDASQSDMQITVRLKTWCWTGLRIDAFRRIAFDKLFERLEMPMGMNYNNWMKLENVLTFVIKQQESPKCALWGNKASRLGLFYGNVSDEELPDAGFEPGKSSIIARALEREKTRVFVEKKASEKTEETKSEQKAIRPPPSFEHVKIPPARVDGTFTAPHPSLFNFTPSRPHIPATIPPPTPSPFPRTPTPPEIQTRIDPSSLEFFKTFLQTLTPASTTIPPQTRTPGPPNPPTPVDGAPVSLPHTPTPEDFVANFKVLSINSSANTDVACTATDIDPSPRTRLDFDYPNHHTPRYSTECTKLCISDAAHDPFVRFARRVRGGDMAEEERGKQDAERHGDAGEGGVRLEE